jgi:hypothetical protein
MRCYEILCVEKLERRAIACNLMRRRDQITWRMGESRRVQHLAYVARRLGSLTVMVQECQTGHDIQQNNATEHCEHLAGELRREEPRWYKASHQKSNSRDTQSSTLDGRALGMVAGFFLRITRSLQPFLPSEVTRGAAIVYRARAEFPTGCYQPMIG